MITTELHPSLPTMAAIEPGSFLGDVAAVVVFGGLAALIIGMAAGPIRDAWRLSHPQDPTKRPRRTLPR